MVKPSVEYEKRIAKYESLVKRQNSIIDGISSLRLISFFLGVGFAIYLYYQEQYLTAWIVFLAFMILFLTLVILHQHYIERRKYSSSLLEVNINSLKRVKGEWREFADCGEEFMDDKHNYSQDLDIFGKGSVFQWINTCVTYRGRHKLKEVLSKPGGTKEEIIARQQAVHELASKINWRQNLNAEGISASKKMIDTEVLVSWAEEHSSSYLRPVVIISSIAIPIATISSFVIFFLTHSISPYIPPVLLVLQFMMIAWGAGRRNNELGVVNKYSENIKVYAGLLELFEREEFKSPYIKELQKMLLDNEGSTAYSQVRELGKIDGWVSNRKHMLFLVIDIIFLVDYRFMYWLETWRRRSGKHLRRWLDVIGEAEALASLSLIGYDNPDWCFPEIVEKACVLSAESMGHPLMGDTFIRNNLRFSPPFSIMIVTGSNMSGKSTFLRTAGVNLVLAYAGASVYAAKFSCSIMELHTCMRVRDDLEKNISSFYAELIRIRGIVEAVKLNKPVFFLLDEIFKGTNSIDRHTGAKVLIKKLSNDKVLGLVSTHDLELGELEGESQKVKNFHFQEHYKNNKISFDYKLYSGISTTRNAVYLMKMAGIEFDDKNGK